MIPSAPSLGFVKQKMPNFKNAITETETKGKLNFKIFYSLVQQRAVWSHPSIALLKWWYMYKSCISYKLNLAHDIGGHKHFSFLCN